MKEHRRSRRPGSVNQGQGTPGFAYPLVVAFKNTVEKALCAQKNVGHIYKEGRSGYVLKEASQVFLERRRARPCGRPLSG